MLLVSAGRLAEAAMVFLSTSQTSCAGRSVYVYHRMKTEVQCDVSESCLAWIMHCWF